MNVNNEVEPLVSIVTPIYNSQNTLEETIKSVLAQTLKDWELLLVLDRGTTDGSTRIIEDYEKKDARIKKVFIDDGRGTSLARNRALELAKGRFIAFLDSDDLWEPLKLELQLKFMLDNKIAFSCTAFRRMSEDGNKKGHILYPKTIANYTDILGNNTIGCLTVMIDRSLTGPFLFSLETHEDWQLWMSLVKKGFPCYGLKEPLALYRIVKSSRSFNKIEMFKGRWYVLRKLEGLSWLRATLFFLLYAFSSLGKWFRF